jgi:hypothetical protein
MKQVLNSLRFFAVIAIFASIILLVFLTEKKLVQNFKKDIENRVEKNGRNTRASEQSLSQ